MISEKRSSMLHGVLLITLFSCAAFYIGEMNFVKELIIQSHDCRYYFRYVIC